MPARGAPLRPPLSARCPLARPPMLGMWPYTPVLSSVPTPPLLARARGSFRRCAAPYTCARLCDVTLHRCPSIAPPSRLAVKTSGGQWCPPKYLEVEAKEADVPFENLGANAPPGPGAPPRSVVFSRDGVFVEGGAAMLKAGTNLI